MTSRYTPLTYLLAFPLRVFVISWAIGLGLVGAVAVTQSACASRATIAALPPGGAVLVRAREAAVAVGAIQHVSIEMNKVELLSDANTRIVVDAATDILSSIRALPEGWKAVTDVGIQRIEARLDAAGKTKLKPYLEAARIIVAAQ